MSHIFNLAEELEKERKKNKELKEDIKRQEKAQVILDNTNTKLGIENYDLQDKIDKAIEYIEHLDNVFIDSKEQDNIVNILKGDNK